MKYAEKGKKKMKAFLLAAGLGTRLRPLTNTVPKCLVPVQGKPLLDWWLELLKKNGITEVVINTHYLYEQVRMYIQEYNKRDTGLQVIESYESELLGSGGTVRDNYDFIKDEEAFLICYADNLTNINLESLMNYHKEKNGLLTMALFRAAHPEQCGIAQLDEESRIVSFIEKPEKPKSNLANAGIYVARPEIVEYFPDEKLIDFGKDVLPRLVGKMYGWETKDYLIDIGTPENYKKAQLEWRNV